MPIDAFYDQTHTPDRFPAEPMTRGELAELVRRSVDKRMHLDTLASRLRTVYSAGFTPNAIREDAEEVVEVGIQYFENVRVPKIQREAHRLGVDSLVSVVFYRLSQVLQNPDAPYAPLQQSISRLQSVSRP